MIHSENSFKLRVKWQDFISSEACKCFRQRDQDNRGMKMWEWLASLESNRLINIVFPTPAVTSLHSLCDSRLAFADLHSFPESLESKPSIMTMAVYCQLCSASLWTCPQRRQGWDQPSGPQVSPAPLKLMGSDQTARVREAAPFFNLDEGRTIKEELEGKPNLHYVSSRRSHRNDITTEGPRDFCDAHFPDCAIRSLASFPTS